MQSVDLSTPKKTIATMLAAVNDADASSLKQTYLADTPQTQDLASAYANLVIATQNLRVAARTKFASDSNNLGAGNIGGGNVGGSNPAGPRDGVTSGKPPPEEAAQLAAADVQINGDRASVSIPDRPIPIKLQQIKGNWLIDLADFAGGTPQQIGEQAEIDHNLAAAMKETTDEINAGRYASAQEAESAVQQKIHAVIAPQLKIIPTTMATTEPAATTAPQSH